MVLGTEQARDPGRWRCCGRQPEGLVDPALQSVIEAMSLDERMELVEFIESSVDQSAIELTETRRP